MATWHKRSKNPRGMQHEKHTARGRMADPRAKPKLSRYLHSSVLEPPLPLGRAPVRTSAPQYGSVAGSPQARGAKPRTCRWADSGPGDQHRRLINPASFDKSKSHDPIATVTGDRREHRRLASTVKSRCRRHEQIDERMQCQNKSPANRRAYITNTRYGSYYCAACGANFVTSDSSGLNTCLARSP